MNEDQGPLASAKALHLFRRRPSPGHQSEKTKQKKTSSPLFYPPAAPLPTPTPIHRSPPGRVERPSRLSPPKMAPRRRGGGGGAWGGQRDGAADGMTVALLSRAVGGAAAGAGRKLAPSSYSYYGTEEALLRRLKPSGPVLDASAGLSDNLNDFRRFSSLSSSSLPTITMTFSPLGGTLATASSDDVGKIRLWDAASRRPRPSHVVEVVRREGRGGETLFPSSVSFVVSSTSPL